MQETQVLARGRGGAAPLRLVVAAGPDAGQTRPLDRSLIVGSSEAADLRLTDPTVSRRHCRIEPRDGAAWIRDEGSKNGVYGGDVRLIEGELEPGSSFRIGETVVRIEIDRFARSEPARIDAAAFGRFVGAAPALAPVLRLAKMASGNDATVLIEGETGTGKELLAEAIHEQSPRAGSPFVVVDCGAMPESLIESELFGHEKGAFTGADRARAGAFEAAKGGSLFLDEIGELSLAVQTRLLGVLDRQQFRRVGADQTITTDVRVIAATNRNLDREVEEGRFRLDLFHRLAVCVLRVPPLRDRLEDLELLVREFAPGAAPELLTPAFFDRLRRHSWPGNVRELRNHVERLVLFGESALLSGPRAPAGEVSPLEAAIRAASGDLPYRTARALVLEAFTDHYVERLLDRHGGNVTSAARAAGVARRHLHRLKRG